MAVPIGLEANKQLMDAEFDLLTTAQTGAIYKAAYDAYYNVAKSALSRSGTSIDSDLIATVDTEIQKTELQLREDANKFATDFCNGISTMLDEIAKQIDAHCKSMIINVMTAAPGPSGTVLACGVGPVTGTIAANNLSPTGGITVN